MTRAWLTTTTGRYGHGQAVAEYLTDAEALDRLERGQYLQPVGGAEALVKLLSKET